MDFQYSARTREYLERLGAFMDEHVYPNEERFEAQHRAGDRWQQPPLLEELKQKARAAALWNLFLPDSPHGAGFTNLEYAPLCERMGRVPWSAE
ncbi:MAG: acyl-CoA dehydrogenase, partial [Steroidobacteraceae bacterium]